MDPNIPKTNNIVHLGHNKSHQWAWNLAQWWSMCITRTRLWSSYLEQKKNQTNRDSLSVVNCIYKAKNLAHW